MLFCDFYKKLKKAIGDTEFGKLHPDRGSKYQKIFMLMTLSVNDKSNGDYVRTYGDYVRTYKDLLKHLKKKFIKLKNDLENLKDSLQELKKEAISLDSLKDRIIVSSTIKDKDILSLRSGSIKANSKTSINNFIIKDFFKARHKDIFKAIIEVGLDKITPEFVNQLLKSEFHKACSDKNLMDTYINPHIDTFTDNFINSLKRNRILIDSIIPEDNRRVAINIKDNDSSINGLVDVINKDINAIDSSEFNKFVAEVEEEERRAEEARKRVAKEKKEAKEAAKKDAEELIRKEKEEAKRVDEEYKRMKKFEDLFNENDIQMIRYSKYLGFSLKNDFPDYSDISVRQIKEYVNYLYFWLNKQNKDGTFKKYCQGDSIYKFANEITPYLVSHPYFIDVINNLPDEQKGKIYEEFHEELKGEIDSLDFLGEKLAALLKKIIKEAADKDLRTLEKLWEKEEDNFLEMVLYPILLDQLYSYRNSFYPHYHFRYSFYLKIRNEKNKVIIVEQPGTFLDNLFFFIAKKKNLFFDDSKLKNILPNPVYIGGIVDKFPYGYDENEKKHLLVKKPIDYFTEEKKTFTDIDQILEFKKTLKNNELYDFDDSFVLIDLTRSMENPLVEYLKKNIDKIGRNLRYKNSIKYEEQKRFWEEKRTSKLYKYIQEKLIQEKLIQEKLKQEMLIQEKLKQEKLIQEKLIQKGVQFHVSVHFPRFPFPRLRDYYLQGECPAEELDMWDYPGKGS